MHGNCVIVQTNPGIYISARTHVHLCFFGGGSGLKTLSTFIFVFVCVSFPNIPQFMTTNKDQICTFRNASDRT